MTVLLTGAAGYVGRFVADELARRGLSFSAVVRRTVDMAGDRLSASARIAVADVSEARAVDALLAGTRPAAVIHLASWADPARCERDPGGAEANVLAPVGHLLAGIARANLSTRFLLASTDLVFAGDQGPYGPGDPPQPIGAYGRLKVQAEQAVLAAGGAVARIALVGGPARAGTRGSFLSRLIDDLSAGRVVTAFVDERRTPIDVRDLASALVALSSTDAAGVFHLGGGDPLTRLQIAERTLAALGGPRSLIDAVRLADVTHAAPRAADVALDSSATWALLGLGPRPFAETIRDAVAWAGSAGQSSGQAK